ncbi:universal stress protein [Haloarcula pellucida]|uniref:Universal stress protein UspA n=1 Tax=Haloarcula pellucida TaxID=1427151 RepID=A0A830GQ98_9EURY|nr:universal stress protein [Halomicroarcula pellucida]MBX0350047.1 universal stress protein [Halomicroarcula pellucida]GGO00155.1 universal stress protein UspA [Halomicroarcula pellucida]
MYDDILLPTDGSDGIAAAAEHAGNFAHRFDATVHVLSVVDTRNRFESPTAGLSAEAWTEAERERAEQAVDDTVSALPESVPVETAVVEGVPRSEILAYVEDERSDLVVMGTHGRTGLDHYLIGSVAEKVVRRSPVPVVTVRLTAED